MGFNGVVAILKSRVEGCLDGVVIEVRLQVAVHAFDDLRQLEGWLRQEGTPEQPIAAVLVDSSYFEAKFQRILLSSILAVRKIPLVVVGAAVVSRNWCEIGGAVRSGMPIYLTTPDLLPGLFAHLRQQRAVLIADSHRQLKETEYEKTYHGGGRFGDGAADDRLYLARGGI